MGAQDEVGIFPSPLRALPQSWARSQTSDAERILLEHRIQPEICDSSCERTCCGEASGAAATKTTAALWPARAPSWPRIWEAAGYPWSVRLKALLPGWMPWIGKR